MTAAERSRVAAEQRRHDRLAELAVLGLYDRRRSLAGHDYGAGQRTAELHRRRRELEGVLGRDELVPDAAVVRLAVRRLAASRLRRLEREDYRTHTPASSRTVATWRSLLASVDELEVYGRGDVVDVTAGAFSGCRGARVDWLQLVGPHDVVEVRLQPSGRHVFVYAEQLERVACGS